MEERSSRKKRPYPAPLAILTGLALLVSSCGRGVEEKAARLTGGDPRRGREIIPGYGCPVCHTIPGVRGADGLVGPPLEGIASRVYLAGILPNTPENVMRWIRFPRQIERRTAMPNTGVTEADVRDIAAYLYTLR